jgi:hypothetical protein
VLISTLLEIDTHRLVCKLDIHPQVILIDPTRFFHVRIRLRFISQMAFSACAIVGLRYSNPTYQRRRKAHERACIISAVFYTRRG